MQGWSTVASLHVNTAKPPSFRVEHSAPEEFVSRKQSAKQTFELKQYYLKREYNKQQLNKDIQQVLDTPRWVCLAKIKPGEVCLQIIGSHIPSYSAIRLLD